MAASTSEGLDDVELTPIANHIVTLVSMIT